MRYHNFFKNTINDIDQTLQKTKCNKILNLTIRGGLKEFLSFGITNCLIHSMFLKVSILCCNAQFSVSNYLKAQHATSVFDNQKRLIKKLYKKMIDDCETKCYHLTNG